MSGIKELLIRYKRPILFLVIGGINTVVDFLVFTVTSLLLPTLSASVFQACGYGAGILCSYILNQTFTFKDAEPGSTLFKVLRFLVVNAVTLGISMVGIQLLDKMGWNLYIAKILITCVTMVVNYLGYKVFVFRVKGR